MSREITKGTFLQEVATHQMQIIRDDGVNRHVRFKSPGTIAAQFDLITWPGHLCYTGDMGTYVFSRIKDMFEFFRADKRHGDGLHINRGYWSEKVLAADRHGKITEFSGDQFVTRLREALEECIAANRDEWDDDYPAELRARFDDEVAAYADDGEHAARQAAEGFEVDDEQVFTDLWEYDFHRFTDHFTWCCLALAWGIKQYDAAKQPAAET